MSDPINLLPLAQEENMHPSDFARIQPFIKESFSFAKKNKSYIFYSIVFLVLSLPFINSLFKTFIGSGYLVALVKTILFIIAIIIIDKVINKPKQT